jgi:hypothetical protein
MTARPSPAELAELERLCAAGDRACIDGTPMIPLHKDTVRKLIARIAELERALTPSRETKAAYIGEFKFSVTRQQEMEDGLYSLDYNEEVTVPWPTIKAIMAAILARAALPEEKPHG